MSGTYAMVVDRIQENVKNKVPQGFSVDARKQARIMLNCAEQRTGLLQFLINGSFVFISLPS